MDRVENLGRRVAIVGAGYAGMAAAVTLAERGVPVAVFESGPVPGGRARRVVSKGTELDNGQHILVGAYSELLRMMRKVGVGDEALLRLPLDLRYASGFRLRARTLPFPLGLLAGLLLARGVPLRERVAAARFMSAMKRAQFRLDEDVSVEELQTVGERRLNMLRAYNAREGIGREADTLPKKLQKALVGGKSDGLSVPAEELEAAKDVYYAMAGWDVQTGRPTRAKLAELGLDWVADMLPA